MANTIKTTKHILNKWIDKHLSTHSDWTGTHVETKGAEGKNYNLNYVRQLRGGYNNFYGDNIFILKRN